MNHEAPSKYITPVPVGEVCEKKSKVIDDILAGIPREPEPPKERPKPKRRRCESRAAGKKQTSIYKRSDIESMG